MTRKPLVWYGVLGAMFFISLWRLAFTVFPIHSEGWTLAFLPVFLAAIGMAFVIYGWQSATTGWLPKAGAVLGLSAALLFRLADPAHTDWLPALGLVPALAGAGMLSEISRGNGWQYTRSQGAGLILYGGLISLAFFIFTTPGGLTAGSVTQLNLYTGWSVFFGTILEIWIFFGSFFERIVR